MAIEGDGSLERECQYCEQTGKVINPKIIEWQLNDFEGEQPKEIMIICPICNGIGRIPTHMGCGILDFIDRYDGGNT